MQIALIIVGVTLIFEGGFLLGLVVSRARMRRQAVSEQWQQLLRKEGADEWWRRWFTTTHLPLKRP